MAIKAKGKKSLFQTIKQTKKPVYEQETVNNMKEVLTGKITGNKATEIRKMFMGEFGSEALNILKKELKIK